MASDSPVSFRTSSHSGSARRGVLSTLRGEVQTPAFMPVGTLGTIKAQTIDQVRATGAEMVLGNTYHLALRPGAEVVAALGGLHHMMGWDGPILTDSGGFQVFSLGQNTKISEESVVFRSHIDGSVFDLSPERAVAIQEALGSDIAMVLDHVPALPSSAELIEEACERSIRWAQRCRDAQQQPDRQALFGIVQGGLNQRLRLRSAAALQEIDFLGYAIGGLSVGESPAEMYATLDYTCAALPADKPRYLMGVGRPQDLLEGIARGVDMFDCVMPTRNARNALAFTHQGPLRLRNASHQTDLRPLEEDCPCLACRHSRGYLRHLFIAGEMLGPILLTSHNLTYYQRLMAESRAAIEAGRFDDYRRQRQAGWAT